MIVFQVEQAFLLREGGREVTSTTITVLAAPNARYQY